MIGIGARRLFMTYRLIDLELKVNEKISNRDDLQSVTDTKYNILESSFVTYIYYNLTNKRIYIGETKHFLIRHNQHMDEKKFKEGEFDNCLIVYNASEFSASHVKDLEYMLINYMFAESDITKFTIQNGNSGQRQPKDFFNPGDFITLWEEELFKRNLVKTKNLQQIKNKILFKYSPFKQLSKMQSQYENEIVSNPNINHLITGGAGTGKTVLLMSLMYRLATENPNMKIGLVTTGNLTNKFNKILKQLKLQDKLRFERAGKLILDARKNNEKYHIILVDESHRLQRYYPKGHPEAKKHFDIENPIINELQMLQEVSERVVLFYDPFQSVRPQDILRGTYLEQTSSFTTLPLNQQFRIASNGEFSGDDFVKGVLYALNLSNDNNFNPEIFTYKNEDSYFRVVNSIKELFNYVEDMDCSWGDTTNRVIAGYTKEWASNPNLKKNKGINRENLPYDWIEEGNKWRWNSQHERWVELEKSKTEIGSIHAIQGADLDHIGVIIGNDIQVGEQGKLRVVKENYKDKGGTPLLSEFNEEEFTNYVLNIYYILLTRGISGCRVYFEDPEVREYFEQKITEGVFTGSSISRV